MDSALPTSPPPPRANRSPWTWKDVVAITGAAVVILVAGLVAIRVILAVQGVRSPEQALSTPFLSLAIGALESIALIGAVGLLGLMRKRLAWSGLGLRPASLGWLLAALVLGLLALPTSNLIALAVQTALGRPLQNPQQAFLEPGGMNLTSVLLMLVFVGILAPFGEEIFFRGVLYNWLRGRWSWLPAALVSALIFGAAHGEPAISAATFVLGFVLAAVYEASGSLWTAFVIHAVNNSAVVVILYAVLWLAK